MHHSDDGNNKQCFKLEVKYFVVNDAQTSIDLFVMRKIFRTFSDTKALAHSNRVSLVFHKRQSFLPGQSERE